MNIDDERKLWEPIKDALEKVPATPEGIATLPVRARIALAEHKDCPPILLSILAKDSDSIVLSAAAANKNTPPESLDALVDTTKEKRIGGILLIALGGRAGLLEAIASNPNMSEATLTKLTDMRKPKVNHALAENPKTPWIILQRITDTDDAELRRKVAENPSADPETLNELSHDQSSLVRWAVARNESTDSSELNNLSNDGYSLVREAVAHNPYTPLSVVKVMAETDPEIRVVAIARQALALPMTKEQFEDLLIERESLQTDITQGFLQKNEEARAKAAEELIANAPWEIDPNSKSHDEKIIPKRSYEQSRISALIENASIDLHDSNRWADSPFVAADGKPFDVFAVWIMALDDRFPGKYPEADEFLKSVDAAAKLWTERAQQKSRIQSEWTRISSIAKERGPAA